MSEPPAESPSATLDTRGLLCPMPVIRTQQAIKELQPGQTLAVIASDPGTMHDIPAWIRVHGHTLVQTHESADEFSFLIQVT